MTNLERQRAFCARNPHYYRDRHRRKKAQSAAIAKLMAEHPELTSAQAHAIAQGKAPAPGRGEDAKVEAPTPSAPETPAVPEAPVTLLALPAPEDVANPTVTITLPDAFTYEPAKIRIITEPRK